MISMFTTANGFLLVLMIQLMNVPSISIYKNDLEQLMQFPTRLGDEPKILNLFLTPSPYTVKLFPLWVPRITFLSLYPLLSLQVFRRRDSYLLKGNVYGISVLQAGRTCGRTSLISRGMNIAYVGGVPRSVRNALP